MENLKIYRINEQYVSFLHSRDTRVQYNKGTRRPYVGVVLYVSNFRYFVPMESPKPNHASMKPGSHFMRIDSGKLGLLGFNNMLPVPPEALVTFDIDAEEDLQYADLLRRQVTEINRKKADVLYRANKTYHTRVNGNNQFYNKICCDFKKLERACQQYDPNRTPRKKTAKT